MKKIIGFVLIFSLLGQTSVRAETLAPECFAFSSTLTSGVTQDSEIYLRAPFNDIYALQGGKNILVNNIDSAYKYIPFTTNIPQESDNGTYQNRYSFAQIDTDSSRDITLSFEKPLQNNTFFLSAEFNTQYYSPLYYISENSEDYSLVLKNDMSDFDVSNIRIVFEPIGELPVREKISINELSVLQRDTSFQLSEIDTSSPVNLYAGNRCERAIIDISDNRNYNSEINFISPVFQENPLFNADNSDRDSDGISDLNDNCVSIANRNQEDINSNGIGDACEFDSDEDGIADSIDNCRNTPNPLQLDDDNDAIGNSCDNCNIYNPNQRDENSNGIGDVCESQANYLSENDDDSDRIINFSDNCRYVANPLQEDSDSDGVGNICDNCQMYKNPNQEDLNKNGIGDICEDSDSDGIDGLRDNCMNTPNPDQEDSDNDGIGNLCEDDDNDAIIFVDDNCPYEFNPDQKDYDNDGIGNVCDENDDRVLESNKTVFIILMLLVIVGFCIGIYSVMRQIKK